MHNANGVWVGWGLGDTGPEVVLIQHRLLRAYETNSHAFALGVTEDGIFDAATKQAVTNVQPFLHPAQSATGIVDYATEKAMGALAPQPIPPAYRPIWIYSAPGSGAPYWLGPPFEVGEFCRTVLHFNHQPVGYPIGGYLGLMGGDPGLSYNDVIALLRASLKYLLEHNPDVTRAMNARRADPNAIVDVELWFTAYSQSADGMEDALVELFGDASDTKSGVAGEFRPIRDRINGTLMFGNPSRQPGPTKVGNNPPGWGISRKIRPQWLIDLTWSITATTPGAPDFYACTDDEIRPMFYKEIVGASTKLSFFQHICAIVIPVLTNLFGPLLGGLLLPMLGSLLGQVLSAGETPQEETVDQQIEQLLSVKGVLTNIPALFKLLGALPGIQTHGSYDAPHDEFGGRTGVQVAQDAVASFRR